MSWRVNSHELAVVSHTARRTAHCSWELEMTNIDPRLASSAFNARLMRGFLFTVACLLGSRIGDSRIEAKCAMVSDLRRHSVPTQAAVDVRKPTTTPAEAFDHRRRQVYDITASECAAD